jgi:Zn ribbon nucleic-acid-binding protein
MSHQEIELLARAILWDVNSLEARGCLACALKQRRAKKAEGARRSMHGTQWCRASIVFYRSGEGTKQLRVS